MDDLSRSDNYTPLTPQSAQSGSGNESRPQPEDLKPGQLISERYEVVSRIGRGGIGTVYRVNQIFLKKAFALKTLDPIFSTAETLMRFQKEAQAAGRLNHRHIVKAYDFGMIEDVQPFLVMDLVEGKTLAQILRKQERLSIELFLEIFIPLCDAIAYAHGMGLIHRDLKPGNIVLATDPEAPGHFIPKLIDFGLAKAASGDGDSEQQAITKLGDVLGTPLYMSPEQCTGKIADKRSDVYSLGCVMFEALTGKPPLKGESSIETMSMHRETQQRSLRDASGGLDFPPELEHLVTKMLEKNPADRYQSFEQVVNYLSDMQAELGTTSGAELSKVMQEFASGAPQPTTSKRGGLVLGATVAVLALLITAAFAFVYLSDASNTKSDRTSYDFENPLTTIEKAKPKSKRSAEVDEFDNLEELDDYSSIVDGTRVFKFPKNCYIGKFFYRSGEYFASIVAEDKVELARSSKLILKASPTLLAYPAWTIKFQEGDYNGLIVEPQFSTNPDEEITSKCVAVLLTHDSVSMIEMQDVEVSEQILVRLQKLPDLRWLAMRSCRSTPANLLAQFNNGKNLKVLNMREVEAAGALLKNVASSPNSLERLCVNQNNFGLAEVSEIAKLKSLKVLQFHEGRRGRLDAKTANAMLDKLASLPKLNVLIVSSDMVASPEAASKLAKFKSLQALYLTGELPAIHMKEMRLALKNCAIRVDDKGTHAQNTFNIHFNPLNLPAEQDGLW